MAKANILFVEDSKTQGAKTKDFLEKSGYAVTWVMDGMSVFRLAKTLPFDVMLLDRVLPDMDGNKVCRWLKQNEDTKGIQIIMLTAMGATTEKVAGLEAGADDYLPKPYDEAELNARVYAALRTKALRDELSKANRELKELLSKVEALSATDPLTGLFNRRRFSEVLESEYKKASRYETPLSCMMIDIDHFKAVNDTYGHARRRHGHQGCGADYSTGHQGHRHRLSLGRRGVRRVVADDHERACDATRAENPDVGVRARLFRHG